MRKTRSILESVDIAKRYRQAAAFILAGGVSSRMGREKGLAGARGRAAHQSNRSLD